MSIPGNGGGGRAAPLVSFEFFPPKNAGMEKTLWETIRRLEPLAPRFVSVTCGAGGSATGAAGTHKAVTSILAETSLAPTAHLTVAGASREEVDAIARKYWECGIRRIVALRGDLPGGVGTYEPRPDGYAYAVDLVEGLKKIGDFDISVAAYPETHPDAPDPAFDLDNLKRKIDAGADRAITQFFFGTDVYLRFLERARAAGIDAPIVAGILPVTNYATVVRFSGLCGTNIPDWVSDLLAGLDKDGETFKLLSANIAIEQCRRLHEQGVDEFHFYTLNRPDVTVAICHGLGVRAREG